MKPDTKKENDFTNLDEVLADKKKRKIMLESYMLIVSNLYLEGLITDDDLKSSTGLGEKIVALRGQMEYGLVVDWRIGVIKSARKFRKQKNFMFANVFYLMYFEHTINSIIQYKCKEKKFSSDTTDQLLRRVNWSGKYTWVMEVLDLPPFDQEPLKVINKVAENRNYITHYKFPSRPLNSSGSFNLEADEEFAKEIEKTVTYLRKYERLIKKVRQQKLKEFVRNFLSPHQK